MACLKYSTQPLPRAVPREHLFRLGKELLHCTRLTGASKNTVAKLLTNAGKACAAYHDAHLRDVKAARVQVDEIWRFTYAKQKNVASPKDAPEGAGDTWTWTAIDADSKLIVSYLVGGRDAEYAMWFMDDRKRCSQPTAVQGMSSPTRLAG